MTDRIPNLNKRDPSGTRTYEDEMSSKLRSILSDGIAAATARIIGKDVSADKMNDILSEEIEGDVYKKMYDAETESIKDTANKSNVKTDKILKRMGIILGPAGKLSPETEASLELNVQLDIQSLTLDTKKSIVRAITEAEAKGLGAEDTAKLIADETDMSLSRASTIARTTVMKTYNTTAMDRYDKAGCIGYYIYPVNDVKLCNICMKEAVGGGGFILHRERPSVPIHPNCRCVVLPAFDGEEPLKFSAYRPTLVERLYYFMIGGTV